MRAHGPCPRDQRRFRVACTPRSALTCEGSTACVASTASRSGAHPSSACQSVSTRAVARELRAPSDSPRGAAAARRAEQRGHRARVDHLGLGLDVAARERFSSSSTGQCARFGPAASPGDDRRRRRAARGERARAELDGARAPQRGVVVESAQRGLRSAASACFAARIARPRRRRRSSPSTTIQAAAQDAHRARARTTAAVRCPFSGFSCGSIASAASAAAAAVSRISRVLRQLAHQLGGFDVRGARAQRDGATPQSAQKRARRGGRRGARCFIAGEKAQSVQGGRAATLREARLSGPHRTESARRCSGSREPTRWPRTRRRRRRRHSADAGARAARPRAGQRLVVMVDGGSRKTSSEAASDAVAGQTFPSRCPSSTERRKNAGSAARRRVALAGAAAPPRRSAGG